MLELVVGDLTAQPVDALITATGLGPRGYSQVELAVRRRAGAALEAAYDESVATYGGVLPEGHALLTDGFALSARHVIHCRPPSYDAENAHASMRGLRDVVRTALARAAEAGARSVALASLGTGAYGFPARIAAPTTLAEATAWLTRDEAPRLVRVVAFGPKMLSEYAEAAMRVLPSFVPTPTTEGGLSIRIARALR